MNKEIDFIPFIIGTPQWLSFLFDTGNIYQRESNTLFLQLDKCVPCFKHLYVSQGGHGLVASVVMSNVAPLIC